MNLINSIFLAAAGSSGSGDISMQKLGGLDTGIVIVYILGVIAVGLLAGRVMKKKASEGAGKDYFLAGGKLRWPMIGLALFATNISCVHLISLAQSGFDTGLLQGNFELMAALVLIMLSLFFAPFYIKSKVATLPDFIEKRYSRPSRDMLALFSIVSAITIHIGFSFLTGGIVLRDLFGVNIYVAICVIAGLTALYTVVGGLLAVVWTEAVQTVVLLVGAGLITWFAFDKMGGWSPMVAELAKPDGLGETNEYKLSMLRPHGDPDGTPWYAILLGYPVIAIWYWCADQTIVQRVLGAENENHARVGPLFAGFLKILPLFLFVLPGVFAFTLFKSDKLDLTELEKDGVVDVRVAYETGKFKLSDDKFEALKKAEILSEKKGRHLTLNLKDAAEKNLLSETQISAAKAQGVKVHDTKGVYTAMITQLLPVGVQGIVVAALLAALMSTVSGALNSISTLAAFDMYKRFKPDASDRSLVSVGRIAAVAALLLAIGLVPFLMSAPSIFEKLNDILVHIAPPVTCVFVLGVFWKKANAISALTTLIVGAIAGVTVFIISHYTDLLASVPYMMKAVYLFIFCLVVQISTALLSKQTVPESSAALCWDSPLDPLRQPGWKGIGNYKVLSFVLLVVMGILYWIFR